MLPDQKLSMKELHQWKNLLVDSFPVQAESQVMQIRKNPCQRNMCPVQINTFFSKEM